MSLHIPYDTVKDTVKTAFLNLGLSEKQIEVCSAVYTQSSADGVENHELNRISRFAGYVQKGRVNLEGKSGLMDAKGVMENYDGHLGIGIISTLYCTDRVMELVKVHGIGCIPLKNTTHWMRDGTYAWYMAGAGLMGISWTNTESCMPLWGSGEPGAGNNPFYIAIPRRDGPTALGMAISQYAYGELGVYRLAGKGLPSPGGFDKGGNLTSDPGATEESKCIPSTGCWKGGGTVIALDMAATLVANENYGADMDEANNGDYTGCCQIFIAFGPYLFGSEEDIRAMLNKRVTTADTSHPEREGGRVICPGKRTVTARAENIADGVCVDGTI